MKSNIQKLIYLLLLCTFTGCSIDRVVEPIELDILPESLFIAETVGIKLENSFAKESIRMNVKLDTNGTYYIKVIDNRNIVVSKEKVNGQIGNNLFKVYTSTLPKSSYRLELYLDENKVGATAVNLL